jgi:uncharacterized membrane protein
MLTPSLRRAALVGHVTTSVGWFGAVAAFLLLAVTALHTADPSTSRALYIAMEVLGRALLVPLALASLATGILQALGTSWGLWRHWWVIVKLVLTVVATLVLVTYTATLTALADAARESSGDPRLLPSASPVLHSGAGLVVLLSALVLSIYKPRGLTRHGWRRQQQGR